MSKNNFLKHINSSQLLKSNINETEKCLQAYFSDEDFNRKSTCNSTTISAMQLFHELKQKNPSVPDHVVNQYVVDYYQNEDNHKNDMEKKTPSVESPKVILPIGNNKSMCKKKLQSRSLRYLHDSNTLKKTNENNHLTQSHNNPTPRSGTVSNKENITTTLPERSDIASSSRRGMPSGVQNHERKTIIGDQKRALDLSDCSKENPTNTPPNCPPVFGTIRSPSFRNREDFSKKQQTTENTDQRCTSHGHDERSKFPKNIDVDSHATCTLTSTLNYPLLSQAEICVNVAVSPRSINGHLQHQQRHQSTIFVRPEFPFVRNFESPARGQKSYTSVNLILRQPTLNPQAPIDITIGPHITYSSSSLSKGPGYQNNYQITVTDGGSIFSSFRIHPVHCSTSKSNDNDRVHPSDGGVHCPDNQNLNTGSSCNPREDKKVISKQQTQLEKLSEVLCKDNNKLNRMKRIMEAAMVEVNTEATIQRLDCEIRTLLCGCQAVINEIEYLGNKDGINENFMEDTGLLKSTQHQPFQNRSAFHFLPASSLPCLRQH